MGHTDPPWCHVGGACGYQETGIIREHLKTTNHNVASQWFQNTTKTMPSISGWDIGSLLFKECCPLFILSMNTIHFSGNNTFNISVLPLYWFLSFTAHFHKHVTVEPCTANKTTKQGSNSCHSVSEDKVTFTILGLTLQHSLCQNNHSVLWLLLKGS